MEHWSKEEILEEHSEDIRKWREEEGLGETAAANRLTQLTNRECKRWTMRGVYVSLGYYQSTRNARPIEVVQDELPSEDETIDALIASRIKANQRYRRKAQRHKRSLTLPSKPFGILCFGDPHVDNEGCDWELLHHHVMLAKETEGVLAASVGDQLDNWIGRLAKCYASTSMKASDGWKLSEWLLKSLQWIALVGGNHDAWATVPGLDPLEWITKQCGVICYAPDELRITLKWEDPVLEPLVWVLRHDFKGRSWFHATHGPNKEAMLDGKCHLLTAGHIHQWGQLTTEQRHGRITHAVRVRGYKRADSYARMKGFYEQEHGASCLIVIDPEAQEPSRITIYWDIEEGCNYLTYLRSRQNNT